MRSLRPPTDYRKLHQEMNRQLLWIVLFVLVVIGGICIGIAYGPIAAVTGVAFLIVGGGVIGLLWLLLTLIGKWIGED